MLRCEVAARQKAATNKVDNAAWITPIKAERMDNLATYRYRDPERRRAQVAEAMKRYRARLKG